MSLVKSLNEMLAAAQTVEYLDIDGLPLMRLLAVLPTHELSSGCLFPSLSLPHTHTQSHQSAMKALSHGASPSLRVAEGCLAQELRNHPPRSRYCRRVCEGKLIPPELFPGGITEQDSEKVIFPVPRDSKQTTMSLMYSWLHQDLSGGVIGDSSEPEAIMRVARSFGLTSSLTQRKKGIELLFSGTG